MTAKLNQLYILFAHPHDYPDRFVLRSATYKGDKTKGALILSNNERAITETIDECRSFVPEGFKLSLQPNPWVEIYEEVK
jgi:hypothetical protein